MVATKIFRLATGLALLIGPAALTHAQTTTQYERIQVTATRVPEDVISTPASVTVISGEELAARGVDDLAGALSLVAGVNVAPGGDGGPAGSVPEIWGLREFDAFLLVVDGVPWGGAFNPALPSLDLTNVERIEVLRGSAPVMYGATSFVGVIQVIHRAAGDTIGSATLGVRNHGGGLAAVVVPLAAHGSARQSLTVNGERRGYDDARAGFDRGHLLYRATADSAAGALRLDADVAITRQDPSSPHPREGGGLSPRVPLDANHQPKDAHLDEDRFHLVAGLDRKLAGNPWTSTLAVTHTRRDLTRGFLSELDDAADPNAAGFRQDQTQTDVYFDSHLVLRPAKTLQIVAGVDLLYGKGKSEGDNVDYHVNLDGSGAQDTHDVAVQESPELEDERPSPGSTCRASGRRPRAGAWRPACGSTGPTRTRRGRSSPQRATKRPPAAPATPGRAASSASACWPGTAAAATRSGPTATTATPSSRRPSTSVPRPRAEFSTPRPRPASRPASRAPTAAAATAGRRASSASTSTTW